MYYFKKMMFMPKNHWQMLEEIISAGSKSYGLRMWSLWLLWDLCDEEIVPQLKLAVTEDLWEKKLSGY